MNLFLFIYLLAVDLFAGKIDLMASYTNSKLSSNLNTLEKVKYVKSIVIKITVIILILEKYNTYN